MQRTQEFISWTTKSTLSASPLPQIDSCLLSLAYSEEPLAATAPMLPHLTEMLAIQLLFRCSQSEATGSLKNKMEVTTENWKNMSELSPLKTWGWASKAARLAKAKLCEQPLPPKSQVLRRHTASEASCIRITLHNLPTSKPVPAGLSQLDPSAYCNCCQLDPGWQANSTTSMISPPGKDGGTQLLAVASRWKGY